MGLSTYHRLAKTSTPKEVGNILPVVIYLLADSMQPRRKVHFPFALLPQNYFSSTTLRSAPVLEGLTALHWSLDPEVASLLRQLKSIHRSPTPREE